MEGRIKWFSREEGYGFIARDEGEDVFFHFTVLERTGFTPIEEGLEVEFEFEESSDGPKATKVVPSSD
jgi:CspA family cold shock protein